MRRQPTPTCSRSADACSPRRPGRPAGLTAGELQVLAARRGALESRNRPEARHQREDGRAACGERVPEARGPLAPAGGARGHRAQPARRDRGGVHVYIAGGGGDTQFARCRAARPAPAYPHVHPPASRAPIVEVSDARAERQLHAERNRRGGTSHRLSARSRDCRDAGSGRQASARLPGIQRLRRRGPARTRAAMESYTGPALLESVTAFPHFSVELALPPCTWRRQPSSTAPSVAEDMSGEWLSS